MSAVAIRVEGLSKQYRIGGPAEPYGSLRESLARAVTNPFRRLRRPTAETEDTTLWALRDVSFEVKHGEVVGIIGRNGAGKSTLLKVLSRITEPTKGRIDLYGRVGSLLEVGTGFHPELTGRENIMLNGTILGMSRNDIKARFDEIVAFAEVERFIDTPVKRYSSGMYLRLAFAVAAHLEPEILVVDEVLAVGDASFQNKCMGKMRDVSRQGRTVLFVSHSLAAVAKLCSHGLLLRDGEIAMEGSAQEVVSCYEAATLEVISAVKDGVVYRAPVNARGSPLFVDRIELLGREGALISTLSTWDVVCFRVWYRATERMREGSVVLMIRTSSGLSLLLCSTSPDSNVSMDFEVGEHFVDCLFEQFPLAAGTYLLGVGLAQPNAAWLYRHDDAAVLSVLARDVFNSGFALHSDRAVIVTPHEWRVGS